jgi:AcrR family transcriptional regulator
MAQRPRTKKAAKRPKTASARSPAKSRSPRKKAAVRKAAKKKSTAWADARSEQRRLKREAVLRVASRLLNQKGYAGMSLADVAGELDIRNASLYYYFESKEELVFACYERAQRIIAETIEQVESEGGSGLDRILHYMAQMRERMLAEGELPLANRVWAMKPRYMKAVIAADRAQRANISRFIDQGIADGSIRPCNPSLTTAMLFSALYAVPAVFLRSDPTDWPALHEEVIASVRHFLESH